MCNHVTSELAIILTNWYGRRTQLASDYSPLNLWLTVLKIILREQAFRPLQKMKDVAEISNGTTGSSHHEYNGQSSRSTNTEIHRLSSPSLDVSKVHGFDGNVMSLERLLLHVHRESYDQEERFKAIGIIGMGGVGKTTLAQVTFNRQKVKNYFLPRIWVCMSKQPNNEEKEEDTEFIIVKRMLICLGVEEEMIESVFKKHGIAGLMFALHLQLKGKRYLIVLDDAWNTHRWYDKLDSWLTDQEEKWGDQLAYGLPKGYGGTVIVTTRSEEVAKKMVGEENIYRLLPLSDPESCFSIFRDSVEKEGLMNAYASNMENLKEEILHKCAGLPLAAKMMGQIMHDQSRPKPAQNDMGQINQEYKTISTSSA